MVTRYSENDVVDRGYKAILLIHKLTNRVPSLIEQSHLERNEGICSLSLAKAETNEGSLDHLLVPYLPGSSHPMLESLPGDKASGLFLPPALAPLTRTCVGRPSRMDRNLRRGPISAHLALIKARGISV